MLQQIIQGKIDSKWGPGRWEEDIPGFKTWGNVSGSRRPRIRTRLLALIANVLRGQGTWRRREDEKKNKSKYLTFTERENTVRRTRNMQINRIQRRHSKILHMIRTNY